MESTQQAAMTFADIIASYGQDPMVRDRVFMLYRDRTGAVRETTYGQLYRTGLKYAALIDRYRRARGKSSDDRFHVGFYMQNTPEGVFLMVGCILAGAWFVGVNNAQIGRSLARDLINMDIDLLLVDEVPRPKSSQTFLEAVVEADERFGLNGLYPDFVLARRAQTADHPAGVITLAEALEQTEIEQFQPRPLDSNRTGVIIFTSGTTGAPKGIEVTWGKLKHVAEMSIDILGYTADDVGYVCMPINHSNSLFLNLTPALLAQAKVLVRRRFSASNFVKDITEAGATIWNSVGDPVRYVLSTIGPDEDLSHLPLRNVISTGTNARNRARFSKLFGLEIFTEAFGSTEVGAIGVATVDTPDYCVAKQLPDKDVRIVDEYTGQPKDRAIVDDRGRILNFSQAVGEIVVSQESLGQAAFTGYYNEPEASAAKTDQAGFYHMGDLGALVDLATGTYIIFLGRTGADRLRTKGENYSAAVIEEIVVRHPQVNNASIIGAPQFDSTENDLPVYVLEVGRPADFDLAGFVEFCRAEVPHFAQPAYVRLIKALPMTDTQKIRKPVLLAQFIERTPELDADPDDLIHDLTGPSPRPFTTAEYQAVLAGCIDPDVRTRFQAVTRRDDLFRD